MIAKMFAWWWWWVFVAPQFQGNRRRIVAVYLDPSNFENIGDGHTIADQINEILEPYDLGVKPVVFFP
jgi:hypothetical protein